MICNLLHSPFHYHVCFPGSKLLYSQRCLLILRTLEILCAHGLVAREKLCSRNEWMLQRIPRRHAVAHIADEQAFHKVHA
jgi:hypothetical protein